VAQTLLSVLSQSAALILMKSVPSLTSTDKSVCAT
jgi:hypothetical protein